MLIRQLDGSQPSVAQAPEGVAASAPRIDAPPLPPAAAVTETEQPAADAREAAARAVASANDSLRALTPSLEFEIDPDTQAIVIRLVDRTDKQVLRQVPAKEMLEIARAVERMQLLLLRSRA
jgi:flagellar protein FlaG